MKEQITYFSDTVHVFQTQLLKMTAYLEREGLGCILLRFPEHSPTPLTLKVPVSEMSMCYIVHGIIIFWLPVLYG